MKPLVAEPMMTYFKSAVSLHSNNELSGCTTSVIKGKIQVSLSGMTHLFSL